MKKLACALGCAFLLLSCGKNSLSPQAYLRWLSEKDNGLSKERSAGGLHIKVKYLPAEYLAYKDIKSMELDASAKILDSLRNYYKEGYTFLLTLEPEQKKGDLMLAGVASLEEFSRRVEQMNFTMSDFITLSCGETETSPVLTSLENVYGIKSGRSIYLVFSKEGINANAHDNLVFTFDDHIFNSGKNKFGFDAKDLQSAPTIKI